jgi:hypothetical protein
MCQRQLKEVIKLCPLGCCVAERLHDNAGNRHRANPQFRGYSQYSDGDFTAVGNEKATIFSSLFFLGVLYLGCF